MNFLHMLGQLLGSEGVGGMAPQPQPQAPPQPVPPPEEAPELVVESDGLPPSKYRRGLLGGAFGVGRTGGNILGLIGDAFLMQAGQRPIYSPRLQELREAEALEDYATDPRKALKQYQMVNPQDGLDRWDKYEDNVRADGQLTRQNRLLDSQIEDTVAKRVQAMFRTATPETLGAITKRAEEYYTAKGLTPPTLPTTVAEAQDFYESGLDPLKMLQLESLNAYRQGRLRQDGANEYGRNLRTRETNFNRTFNNVYRTERTEEGKDTRHTTPKAGSGGPARKIPRSFTLPDGTRKII